MAGDARLVNVVCCIVHLAIRRSVGQARIGLLLIPCNFLSG